MTPVLLRRSMSPRSSCATCSRCSSLTNTGTCGSDHSRAVTGFKSTDSPLAFSSSAPCCSSALELRGYQGRLSDAERERERKREKEGPKHIIVRVPAILP